MKLLGRFILFLTIGYPDEHRRHNKTRNNESLVRKRKKQKMLYDCLSNTSRESEVQHTTVRFRRKRGEWKEKQNNYVRGESEIHIPR